VVVGRREPVTVFEPMWHNDSEARKEDLDRFATALEFFYAGDMAAALAGFGQLAGRDPAAAAYVRQCRACLENPPGPDWTGACVMTSK
jgi:adenylate cyclase